MFSNVQGEWNIKDPVLELYNPPQTCACLKPLPSRLPVLTSRLSVGTAKTRRGGVLPSSRSRAQAEDCNANSKRRLRDTVKVLFIQQHHDQVAMPSFSPKFRCLAAGADTSTSARVPRLIM